MNFHYHPRLISASDTKLLEDMIDAGLIYDYVKHCGNGTEKTITGISYHAETRYKMYQLAVLKKCREELQATGGTLEFTEAFKHRVHAYIDQCIVDDNCVASPEEVAEFLAKLDYIYKTVGRDSGVFKAWEGVEKEEELIRRVQIRLDRTIDGARFYAVPMKKLDMAKLQDSADPRQDSRTQKKTDPRQDFRAQKKTEPLSMAAPMIPVFIFEP